MPYKIVKYKNGLARVFKDIPGIPKKYFSKKPIPLNNAIKQIVILEQMENKKRKK